VIEGSTIRGIYEVNFGDSAKMEVYANSRLGIPKLSKIANYGRLLKKFRKYLRNLGKYEIKKWKRNNTKFNKRGE